MQAAIRTERRSKRFGTVEALASLSLHMLGWVHGRVDPGYRGPS